jgi:hypothetical protein
MLGNVDDDDDFRAFVRVIRRKKPTDRARFDSGSTPAIVRYAGGAIR